MVTYKAMAGRGSAAAKPADGGGKKSSGAVDTGSGESNAVTYFSDVRGTGRLQLAHLLIDSRDGQTTQEIRFSKLTINPELKPALFARP